MKTRGKKKKDVFLKELAEAKMNNALDKYNLSKYWYFQKKVRKIKIDTEN